MVAKRDSIIITTSLPYGTIPNYFHKLAEEFVIKGFKVIVIVDNGLAKMPKGNDNLSFFKWPSHRPTSWKDFKFFLSLLKREQPVMTLSNFGSTNVVAICSYLYRVPNRWNYIHTLTFQIKTDVYASKIKSYLLKLRKKIIYGLITHFLTNANGTKTDVCHKYNIDDRKVSVGSYLISDSIIPIKKKIDRKEQFSIVARLNISKGHFELINQFSLLTKEYENAQLVIVGSGSQMDRLKKLTKKLNLDSNVVFAGNVSNDKIGTIYSDCLVSISSSYYEAFGIVNIEALREGTPIICTETSGSLDILKIGVNGEFFALDDNESLLSSFNKINANWESYSAGALESFKKEYSLSLIPNRVEDLIRLLK
jgi:glycosyltransferase involved in cell wall biosynthesis